MKKHALTISSCLIALVLLMNSAPGLAQAPYAPEKLTAADYARGEHALYAHTSPLLFRDEVRPTWIDGHRFWYRNAIPEGKEFILVDAREKTKKRAFDHEKLAAALSEGRGTIEEVIEPYLIQQGFLMRMPRGRVATAHAYRHFGLIPTASATGGDLFSAGS